MASPPPADAAADGDGEANVTARVLTIEDTTYTVVKMGTPVNERTFSKQVMLRYCFTVDDLTVVAKRKPDGTYDDYAYVCWCVLAHPRLLDPSEIWAIIEYTRSSTAGMPAERMRNVRLDDTTVLEVPLYPDMTVEPPPAPKKRAPPKKAAGAAGGAEPKKRGGATAAAATKALNDEDVASLLSQDSFHLSERIVDAITRAPAGTLRATAALPKTLDAIVKAVPNARLPTRITTPAQQTGAKPAKAKETPVPKTKPTPKPAKDESDSDEDDAPKPVAKTVNQKRKEPEPAAEPAVATSENAENKRLKILVAFLKKQNADLLEAMEAMV